MWDLWQTNRHWSRFSPNTLVSPTNYSLIAPHSSLLIIILGLVQEAKAVVQLEGLGKQKIQ
jgi:hypothetical protein